MTRDRHKANKARREKRLAAVASGLCGMCTVRSPIAGRKHCQTCVDGSRESKRKTAGTHRLCIAGCGLSIPRAKNRKFCARCLSKRRSKFGLLLIVDDAATGWDELP